MPRVLRSRFRSFSIGGSIEIWSTPAGPPSISTFNRTFQSSITDFRGRPVIPSGLNSDQKQGFEVLVGEAVSLSTGYVHKFKSYPLFGEPVANSSQRAPLAAPGGWLLDLVASTNPSRPVLTIPELIQDLIEIPRGLRGLAQLMSGGSGASIPKRFANAYLSGKFGWGMLLKDLLELMDLQKEILKRNQELQRLYSGKGLRRRKKFAEITETYSAVGIQSLSGVASIRFPRTSTVTKKSWGTIRWKPIAPPPFSPSDIANNHFTTRLLLGATPEGLAKGLWNVIPWTWLLGWFFNIGQLTLANSNTVPATWSEACFMSESKTRDTTSTAVLVNATGFVANAGSFDWHIKTRVVGSGIPLPGFSMPYLDMGRLSVLGSLFIQRTSR